MKVTVISVVVGALGSIPKRLVMRLEELGKKEDKQRPSREQYY